MRRVAVVTGAARGIGAATVRRLGADGWAVVAVDACADDPAIGYPLATQADLESLAAVGEVRTVRADVRDVAALSAAVAVATEEFGGLDAAIAVAGVIAGGGPHWETDADAEQVVLHVDLHGVLNLARVAVPALLARPEPRSGRFIAVGSAAATRGLGGLAAYGAAKAGVVGFVRGLAADLGDSGVTAVAVNPGSTATRMLDASAALYGLDGTGELVAQQPIGRRLGPEEVAGVLAWLAGTESGGITGSVVDVDGGMSI